MPTRRELRPQQLASPTDEEATFNVACFCTSTCGVETTGRRRLDGVDCFDPLALQYNPDASGDSECVYAVPGCTNSLATNYLALYTTDDGSCVVPVYGCNVATGMINYDSSATVSVGCAMNECMF